MTKQAKFTLDAKQTRTVNRCLREIFSGRSLEPVTLKAYKEMGLLEGLVRQVRVGPEGHQALMSDTSAAAYRRIVEVLAETSAGTDVFTRSDIGNALQEICKTCWKDGRSPKDTKELVDLVSAHIEERIAVCTVAAGLRGVALEGLREIRLGKLKLASSIEQVINEANLKNDEPFKGSSRRLTEVPCLYGSHEGTPDAAQHWYREQAFLTAGMLAVEAGASYERAVSTFYIEPEFAHGAGHGSVYLFWDDKSNYLGKHYTFARGIKLKLTQQRVEELTAEGAFSHAFEILQKRERSSLEEAVCRAVYWYGDAHRDSQLVMQFIKYWSCLEGLLGGPGEKLTETLALGVVSLLTFGHFRLLNESQWKESERAIKRLYALRSKAIHRSSHSHITADDVIHLSSWTAWVIYNAVSLSHAGMLETRTLWQQIQKVSKERQNSGAHRET